MGALSMYALALASGAPPAILDWNNNYAYEEDLCVCTHCGNYPKSFIGDTPEVGELDVLGVTIGRSKCFGAVKGKVKPGPMTYFRLSTDDRRGTVTCYLGQGEFTTTPSRWTAVSPPRACRVCGSSSSSSPRTASNTRRHGPRSPRRCRERSRTRYLGWPIYHHGRRTRAATDLPNRF